MLSQNIGKIIGLKLMQNKIFVAYPIDVEYWNHCSIDTFNDKEIVLQYKSKHLKVDVYEFILVDNYIVKVTKL